MRINSIIEKPLCPTTDQRQSWYRHQDGNGPNLIVPVDKVEEIEETM